MVVLGLLAFVAVIVTWLAAIEGLSRDLDHDDSVTIEKNPLKE